MKILLAEDDPVSRRVLQALLQKWNLDVIVASDGIEAWDALQSPYPPQISILDWMMPGLDGIELCQKIRANPKIRSCYVILLTTKDNKSDIIEGLEAGADDYVIKPFERSELRARIQVGVRVAQLQAELADRIGDLEDALSKVKQLEGFLPICSYCKNVRDDQNYWLKVEQYIADHSEAKFTHSICPNCYETHVQPELEALKNRRKQSS